MAVTAFCFTLAHGITSNDVGAKVGEARRKEAKSVSWRAPTSAPQDGFYMVLTAF